MTMAKYTKILNNRTRRYGGKLYRIAYRPGLMFGESSKKYAKLDAKLYRKQGGMARVAKEAHGYAVYVRNRR
jgi:hypothetical protein